MTKTDAEKFQEAMIWTIATALFMLSPPMRDWPPAPDIAPGATEMPVETTRGLAVLLSCALAVADRLGLQPDDLSVMLLRERGAIDEQRVSSIIASALVRAAQMHGHAHDVDAEIHRQQATARHVPGKEN